MLALLLGQAQPMSARSLNAQNPQTATPAAPLMVICGEGGARLVQMDIQDPVDTQSSGPAHDCDQCPLCFAFGQGDLTLLAPDVFADGRVTILKSWISAGQVISPATPESTWSLDRGPPDPGIENFINETPSLPGKDPVMPFVRLARVS